jgi:hypothetical protein
MHPKPLEGSAWEGTLKEAAEGDISYLLDGVFCQFHSLSELHLRHPMEHNNQLLQLGRISRTGLKHDMKQSPTLDWERSMMWGLWMQSVTATQQLCSIFEVDVAGDGVSLI